MKNLKMKHRKKELCAFLLIWLLITGLQAQETVSTAGGDYIGSGGSVSFSIGQMAYTTNRGEGGSVSPGIQQPYEISVKTEIKGTTGITLQCTVFPNPTTDFVMLKVEDLKIENLSYQLYDMSGKLLKNKLVEGIETKIDMTQFVSATYFLKITQNDKVVKSFKIIKN